ncbi:MAG: ATP-binding cassette domain-containing protein, partial [Nocardioides sp.]
MELKFEGATFGYRSRDPRVLEDFHLDIASGRTILLGPNGAGKSTLLAIAASVVPLSGGRVSIGGLVPN